MTSANAADVLFVVDPYDDVVLRYDVWSGAYLGKMAAITEINGPPSETVDIVRGPDGLLYVGNSGRNPGGGNDKNGVLRFDPVNSTLIDSFVSSGSGGLFNSSGPRMAFGPDGNLFVMSDRTQQVLRYDGTSGAFIDIFADAIGGTDRVVDLQFNHAGDLLVMTRDEAVPRPTHGSIVWKYDGPTVAFIDVHVPAGASGLLRGNEMIIGPDGDLYISNFADGSVHRFN
jgi:hypothetical protein